MVGDSGDDLILGDEFIGPNYETHVLANIGTEIDTHGAGDFIHGGSGTDQLFGNGGDDTIWGGANSDYLDGQERFGYGCFGGGGIDLMILPTKLGSAQAFDTGIDTFDGHSGNTIAGDTADDNATDILVIEGTLNDDVILIGQQAGGSGAQVHYNGTNIDVNMLDNEGNPLIEQFQVAGLTGDDILGFVNPHITAGVAGIDPIDLSTLSDRSNDFVGVFDGNSGNDLLLGSPGRDRLDGGIGSDVLYGFGGDDRLWGDLGGGLGGDTDILFAGSGNDDLIGGQGENLLYSWSLAPDPLLQPTHGDSFSAGNLASFLAQSPTTSFGIYVDSIGGLHTTNGDTNNDGQLDTPVDLDGDGETDPVRSLEITGFNRMLGGPNDDHLFGGTTLDFLYGNGGEDTLLRADGTTFESMDGGAAGDEWKEYARESDLVWYIGGSNAADEIRVDYVTEPGLLNDHHLVTRLTDNNGNFSFAAQIRLDFSATDGDDNPIWDPTDTLLDLDNLLAASNADERNDVLSDLSISATELVGNLLPSEGDFQVILIDALGGNDEVTVGPTVQKSVWIDAGAGDDVVTIRSGNAILVDAAESAVSLGGLRGRNDRADYAFDLLTTSAGTQRAVGDLPVTGGVRFNGLTIDSPTDEDWFSFTLAEDTPAGAILELASGSSIDQLGLALFAFDASADPDNQLTPVNAGTFTTDGDSSSISLAGLTAGTSYRLQVTSPNIVPTIYGLLFNLIGTTDLGTIADFDAVDLGLRDTSSSRRDIILGGTGDDILQGGGGEGLDLRQ